MRTGVIVGLFRIDKLDPLRQQTDRSIEILRLPFAGRVQLEQQDSFRHSTGGILFDCLGPKKLRTALIRILASTNQ